MDNLQKNERLFRFGGYEWNISQITDYIREEGKRQIDLSLNRFNNISQVIKHYENGHSDTDGKASDVLVLIEVERPGSGQVMLIDGHQKLIKALNKNAVKVPCFFLSFEEQIKFMTKEEMLKKAVLRYKLYLEQRQKKQVV